MSLAVVVMTILGCDDGGINCRYIATVDQRWETVLACNDVSESRLNDYRDKPYPVIVAVCQKPEIKTIADIYVKPLIKNEQLPTDQTADADKTPPAVTPEEEKNLADLAIERVRKILPSTEGLKSTVRKPVRLVEDGYSWVASQLRR
ncbi:hypothetical protein [Rhizobium sp. SYY.PMSO]|uniref:hypothetical protein n=1 Tax=Rhizobium sp. SYY.PMSO TaxID=3382192 RepID=UPI003990203E